MNYANDLLDQARMLARREPRRPKQDSLRRAVSASYYALFHFLIDQASRNLIGGGPSQRSVREVVARGLQHGTMKNASKQFATGNLPPNMVAALGATPLRTDLCQLADTVVNMQQERHRADYDLSRPFSRPEVMGLIQQDDDAIRSWPNIKDDIASRLYLTSLGLWDRLRRE